MTSKHLIVFLVAANTAQGCTYMETAHESYSTREEAVQKGAIERGWIPEWIPPSAKDIREVHNIDTNAVIVRYDFSNWSQKEILKHCSQVDRKGIQMPRPYITDQIWWWHLPFSVSAQFYKCTDVPSSIDKSTIWLTVEPGRAHLWQNGD